jgi:hypothetical protein
MDRETWNRFRFGNRKQIALELLGKQDMSSYIKEITWIPLDDQDKLIIAPGYDPQEENRETE